ATQQLEIKRHDNFESWYANNIQFETTEWDLKMIFGLLDFREGCLAIEQHTAMSVGWTQAKILAYSLQVHVAIFEKIHGKITVPPTVWPPEPIPPSDELKASNPLAESVYELI